MVKSTIISIMSDQVEDVFVKNSKKNTKKKASKNADQTIDKNSISTENFHQEKDNKEDDEIVIL